MVAEAFCKLSSQGAIPLLRRHLWPCGADWAALRRLTCLFLQGLSDETFRQCLCAFPRRFHSHHARLPRLEAQTRSPPTRKGPPLSSLQTSRAAPPHASHWPASGATRPRRWFPHRCPSRRTWSSWTWRKRRQTGAWSPVSWCLRRAAVLASLCLHVSSSPSLPARVFNNGAISAGLSFIVSFCVPV